MDESRGLAQGVTRDSSAPQMRARVEFLELAESLAAVGHWELNLQSGALYWSDEIYRIHGVSPDTYTPDVDSAIGFYHPDDAVHVANLIDSAISEKRSFEFAFRLVRPSGDIRHVQCRARVTLDNSGDVVTLFGVFLDTTDRVETKQALHESQMRFELAVRGSNTGLWYWQIQTDELVWSPRYLEIMDITDADFVPSFEYLKKRLHPQDRRRIVNALKAHLKRRIPFEAEYRLRRDNGDYVWIRARGQAEWDDNGQPVRMAGSAEDVTARRRAGAFREAVYAVSTTADVNFESKVAEILNLGRAYLNLDEGTVCKLDGERAVLAFSSDLNTTLGDDASSHVAGQYFPLTCNAGKLLTHADLTSAQRAEFRQNNINSDRTHYVGLPLRVHGKLYGTVSFSSRSAGMRTFETNETSFVPVLARLLSYEFSQRDALDVAVDARRKVEDKQAEVDRILNTVPVRIWYKDDQNRILRLNQKAADSMNLTIEQAQGASTYALFPAMAKKYHEDDQRVIASGEPEFGIVEQYTPVDGPRGWTSTDKIPFKDEVTGEPRLLVVSQDITPIMDAQRNLELQAEELRRTNHDLDHFAYIASHDLRAPMRGIGQLANWIVEDLGEDLDEDVSAKLHLMQQRVKRMDRMLQDILTFARAGKRDELQHRLDVSAVVSEVIALLAPSEGLKVVSEIPNLYLNMARTQFEQIFLNLIGNAVKHHDCSSGTVSLSANVNKDNVVFCVRDDGPGIPLQFQTKVFEMFATLKRRDEREGSGVGLAVVHRVVRAYGGSVTLTSPLTERGTEFRVALPASLVLRNEKIDSTPTG